MFDEIIIRKNGVTTVRIGNIVIKTNLINRHKYNQLRKKNCILTKDFFKAIKKTNQ